MSGAAPYLRWSRTMRPVCPHLGQRTPDSDLSHFTQYVAKQLMHR